MPIKFFKTSSNWFHPLFSNQHKFHFSKGLILGFDIPFDFLPSPFKIIYSLMTNIVQSGQNNGTGWWDLSFEDFHSKILIKE